MNLLAALSKLIFEYFKHLLTFVDIITTYYLMLPSLLRNERVSFFFRAFAVVKSANI